jgi:hypothetical protein
MVPQLAPLQPPPDTVHSTAVFVVPVTVAVNCWLLPTLTWAVAGVTATATGDTIVTEALAVFVGSAVEVAVIVTRAGLGITDGAV